MYYFFCFEKNTATYYSLGLENKFKKGFKLERDYFKYRKYLVSSITLGALVWVSLTAFVVLAKHNMGLENIPVLEAIIFIAGIAGTRIAFSSKSKLRTYIFLDLASESIFIIMLLGLIFLNPEKTGIALYMVFITSALLRPVVNEKMRNFEDKMLIYKGHKRLLSKFRKQEKYGLLTGGMIGAMISVLAVSILGMSLEVFTTIMLVGNIIQNIADYYFWNKYVR